MAHREAQKKVYEAKTTQQKHKDERNVREKAFYPKHTKQFWAARISSYMNDWLRLSGPLSDLENKLLLVSINVLPMKPTRGHCMTVLHKAGEASVTSPLVFWKSSVEKIDNILGGGAET